MKKILWLDDEFGINPEFDKQVDKLYKYFSKKTKILEEEVKKEFQIIPVSNYPEFKEMIKESIFNAVILDIDGMGEADREERSWDGFGNSFRDAIEKKISIVIYSGQVDESEKQIKGYLKFIENKNIECKIVSKKQTVIRLCDALLEIFENDIWIKFPHIRELCESKSFSSYKNDLKKILESYENEEYDSKVANEFRVILEKIIGELQNDFAEDLKTRNESYSRKIFEDNLKKYFPDSVGIYYICKDHYKHNAYKLNNNSEKLNENIFIKLMIECSCRPLVKTDKCFHDEHLVISSAIMPREVKFAFKYIWELSNIYHHCNELTPDFNEIMRDSIDDKKIVNRMSYDAFLLILKWYYQYNQQELYKNKKK